MDRIGRQHRAHRCRFGGLQGNGCCGEDCLGLDFARTLNPARNATTWQLMLEGAWSMTERYRRLEMSLSVRHRLMVHFAHMPEVVAGLRGARHKP